MKKRVILYFIAISLVSAALIGSLACKSTDASVNTANTAPPPDSAQPIERVEVGNAKTPIEAYQMLFKACRAKDYESIKKMMSKKTLEFAKGVAAQTNQPYDQVFKNGFYASTITDKLPDLRDERVKDDFGAVEAWVASERKWEDVSFIREDGGWKVAVGDIYAATYQSPGPSQTIREQTAANKANGGGMINLDANKTANSNSNSSAKSAK